MPTFGPTAQGSQVDELFSGFKEASRYTLPQPGTVSKITLDCDGLGSGLAGAVTVVPVIYADAAGEPGALLAQGGGIVIAHSAPGTGQGRSQLDMPLSVVLAPGNYWLGWAYISGSSQGARWYSTFAVGHGRNKSGGVTDPWGTPSATLDEDIAVFGTYTALTSSKGSGKWRFPGRATSYWKH